MAKMQIKSEKLTPFGGIFSKYFQNIFKVLPDSNSNYYCLGHQTFSEKICL